MVVVDILVFVAVGLYLSRIGLGSGRDGAAAVGHTRHHAHVCGSVAYRDSCPYQTTFWLFAAIFTVLLIAEIGIMLKQIKKGSEQK